MIDEEALTPIILAKSAIVYYLHHFGNIEVDKHGRASTILHKQLEERGAFIARATFQRACAELDYDGFIDRDIYGGTRVRSISLVDLGNFEDPFDKRGRIVVATKVRGSPKMGRVDSILREARMLSMPERLMLSGLLIDEIALEIDDFYLDVNTVLGKVPGAYNK